MYRIEILAALRPMEHILLSKPGPSLKDPQRRNGMKNQQNPAGTTRQTSIKQLDATLPTAQKSTGSRLVTGSSLMAAIKSCVRRVDK